MYQKGEGVFFLKKIVKRTINAIVVLLIIAVICAVPTVVKGYQLYQDAVEETSITEKVSEIRADEDYIALDQISDYFKEQMIKSEDKRFYFHMGFDPVATLRALCNDLIAGAFIEGGSTITQQLAKNMYFDFEKKLERKVAEVFVAFSLEWNYTKDEILELYCNYIYFGEGCYGIKEATTYYFGETPLTINGSQADQLVYTIKCPNEYNPLVI
ncbi:monofunctional glycosyltransferase [Clostridiales Family XIII bacterium PM5-7]